MFVNNLYETLKIKILRSSTTMLESSQKSKLYNTFQNNWEKQQKIGNN